MKKRIILLVVVFIMVFGTATAFASNMDFNFYMTSGGTSAYSDKTWKTDGENAWFVTPKENLNGYESDWIDDETVRFRVRFDIGRTEASGLKTRTTPNYGFTFNYPYLDSTPTYSIYYRLYADKPASDPYAPCTLVGTWCP